MGGFPGCDQAIVFALRVVPDFKDHRTEATLTPPDCAVLFRIVVLLVDKISLIEDLLGFLQAHPVLLFDGAAFVPVIPEPQPI